MKDPMSDRLALEFLERFWSDRDAGRSVGLSGYLQQFRGQDELIAREFLGAIAQTRGEGDSEAPSEEGRIGPYRLLKKLGRGGQGIVWLAEDTRLGRRVALKVLTGLGPGAELHVARFRREAALASKLDHPGICGVHDTGIEGGVPYIAMRYVEGETLAEGLLRAGGPSELPAKAGGPIGTSSVDRRDVDLIVVAFEKVARALHAAHELGIVHRDIKPGNIMVTPDGEPVLLDFGLAQDDSDGAGPTLTKTGDLFGTPAYMSPEQITGRRVRIDRRSDVYSLGATVYECLTLKRPFEAATRESLYQAILSKEPERARKLNRRIPSDLEVVLQCAMSKDRDKRYQTAADFAEDLRRVREGEPILAKKVSVVGRTWRWSKRRPAAAALVCALTLVIPTISGLGVWWWTHRDDVRAQERARQEEVAENALEAGFNEVYHGTKERAVEAFTRALAADPGSAEAVVGLALAHWQTPEVALRVITDGERSVADPRVLSHTKANILTRLDRGAEAAIVLESAPAVEGSMLCFLEGVRVLNAGHKLVGKRAQSEYRRAAEHLARAVASSPRARRAYHCQLAHALGHGGGSDPEGRVALADAMLHLWPGSAAVWDTVGFMQRDWERGADAYRQAIRLDPDRSDYHAKLANCLLNGQKLEEAVAESREALRLDPKSAFAYLKLGAALGFQGKRQESVVALQEGIKLKPPDETASFLYCNLGVGLQELGRLQESVDAYRESIRLNPEYGMAHHNLGVSLQMQDKAEEAIAAFREAIRLDPASQRSYPNLAAHLMNLGRVDEALPFIREAIRLNPLDPAGHNCLGFYMNRKGRFDEAIAPLREALRLDPGHENAQDSLRHALRKLERWDEVVALRREAVERHHDDPRSLNALAWTLVDPATPAAVRNPREAVQLARKAATLTERKVPPILDTLAFALHARGEFEEAVKVQEELLRLLGGKDGGDYTLAHAEAALVRYRDALDGTQSRSTDEERDK